MKLLLAFLILAVPASATPYYQHPILTQSSIQGEMFTGVLKTNAPAANATLVPLLYHNATVMDPWYEPSSSLLTIGYSVGGGNASAVLGPVLNFGPQFIYGIEALVGTVSDAGEAAVVGFFKCSVSATACGSLSAGLLVNLNAEEGGKFSTTWKEWGAHPVGYFIGPSVWFGGPKAAP